MSDIMDKEYKDIQVCFNAQKLFSVFKSIELLAEYNNDDILNIALSNECAVRDKVEEQIKRKNNIGGE